MNNPTNNLEFFTFHVFWDGGLMMIWDSTIFIMEDPNVNEP